MTVLEALRCGIPVVIPTHVGLLDELPETAGIYRYAVGDYDGLFKATEKAMAEVGGQDREGLAKAVEDYTPLRWCQDHVSGFEHLMGEEGGHADPPLRNDIDKHGRRGVLYVAYGKPARDCAKSAVKSLKSFMPDIPVAVVSDEPLGVCDAFIQHADIDIGGRDPKTQIYDLAPHDWEYVMYLDADTEVIASSYFLWQLLEDGWDMVICRNPAKYHVARMMERPDNKDECAVTFRQIGSDEVMQLNGGVFAFQRNPRTEAFFHSWHEEWKIYGKRDQGALLRALWKHPVKLYVLGNEWNNITRYPLPSPTPAAFVNHFPMTARRWRGIVHYRSDSKEAWSSVKEFEKTGGK